MSTTGSSAELKPEQRPVFLTGITSLPHELLAQIFSLYVADYLLGLTDVSGFSPSHPYRWTRITHVCRRWRNIALHMPLLWTHVVFSAAWHVHAIPEMIARAGDRALSLEAKEVRYLQGSHRSRAIKPIFQNIPQACSLRLQIPLDTFQTLVDDIETPHAIHLHAMILYNPSNHNSLPHSVQFAWDLPNLQELILSKFTLDWTSPLMQRRQLTKLVVNDPGVLQSVADVSAALRELSELRYLQLVFLRRGISLAPTRSAERDTKFPHLTFLHLHMAACDMVYLLESFALPVTTVAELEARWDSEGSSPTSDQQLPLRVAEILRGTLAGGTPSIIPIRGLSIQQYHAICDELLLDFYTAPILVEDHLTTWQPTPLGASPKTAPQIRFSLPAYIIEDTIDLFDNYLTHFSLTEVETVHLSNDISGPFQYVLKNMPSVSALRFYDKTSPSTREEDVLEVLSAQAGDNSGDSDTVTWLAPQLDTLVLRNISRSSSAWIGLADVLASRSQCGFPVRSVDIRFAAGLKRKDVAEMRERLGSVGCEIRWDERERPEQIKEELYIRPDPSGLFLDGTLLRLR
ncbi:hypothetical protein EIP91_005466 [Steccherinum ochraceum]|uniref:F-box domain-containing protein n=1 Tax=Steccherinum ochraceum TaxID=92696 RepID=A0A4R0RS02_9APHY|nr:hypothetical protein EIP91_005466 [Steccherinum ochraceum]